MTGACWEMAGAKAPEMAVTQIATCHRGDDDDDIKLQLLRHVVYHEKIGQGDRSGTMTTLSANSPCDDVSPLYDMP